MLRIAFAGTPEFAVPALRALATSSHQLVGVLTQPDRPAGRGAAGRPRELQASPVKRLALELGLPVAQPERLNSEEQRAPLAQWGSELLVVVAYGLLLPPAVLQLPLLGCLNIHASLLPRWRGAAPIQRAILAGDLETGVSIMQMDQGLDTGAVLAQRALAIDDSDAGQLHASLAALGAQLLLETLAAVEAGRAQPHPQPALGVTYAAKITRPEARIDWQRSAQDISRQVRAFSLWPVAETLWHGTQLRIREAAPASSDTDGAVRGVEAASPGQVLGLDGKALLVRCGQGLLAVTRLQLAGRRVLSAAEFVSGQPLDGARFT